MELILAIGFLLFCSCQEPYPDRYGASYPEARVFTTLGAIQNPSYGERYIQVMMNIVRMSPTDARTFGYCSLDNSVILPATYPPTEPMWHHPDLTEAARMHSQDLALVCHNLQHNSCDGTSWSTRINSYFECGGPGENGAWNYGYQGVNDGWLWDGGVLDGQSGDGHRRAIMRSTNRIVGNGIHMPYIFADFSTCTTMYTEETHPIFTGLHLISGSTLKFVVQFSLHSAAARDVQGYVVYDGIQYELFVEFGAANCGNHFMETTYDPETDKCKEYYFLFEVTRADESVTQFLYPMTGSLSIVTGNAQGPLGAGDCHPWVSTAVTDPELDPEIAERIVLRNTATGLMIGLGAASGVGLAAVMIAVFVVAFFGCCCCATKAASPGTKKKKTPRKKKPAPPKRPARKPSRQQFGRRK